MPIIPWSYSSLTSFEGCPYRYLQVRVLKNIKDEMGKEAKEGIKDHEQIEAWLKGNPAPDLKENQRNVVEETIQQAKLIVEEHVSDKSSTPVVLIEGQLGMTKDNKPCDFWDKDCYYRAKLDWAYIQNDVAYLLDWKTGKVKNGSEQLKANSLLIFANYPQVEKCFTRFVFVNHGQVVSALWRRWIAEEVTKDFGKRVIMMQEAEKTGFWPKKKSGLCKDYCPVHTCEHNGNYTGGV